MITSRPQQPPQPAVSLAEAEENVEDYPMQSSSSSPSSRPPSHFVTLPGATSTSLDVPATPTSGNLQAPFVAITSPESRMEPPDANSMIFKIDQHRQETFEVSE